MTVYDATRLTADHRLNADAVVIGTGAGGATVAAVLAQAGLHVVVLEEGGYYTGKDLSGDSSESFRTLYRNNGLTAAIGRPPIVVPVGRCVGGTTMVNSASSFRTPDFVLQKWERDYGLEGATDLAGWYDRTESDLSIKPVPDPLYGPQNQIFETAASRRGWAGRRIPRNEDGCMATGTCALGCPTDGKLSMAVSRVPQALSAGAQLWVRARAIRILRAGNRVFGVVAQPVDQNGKRSANKLIVTAEMTVVACGALHTPALLMASGIRNRWIGRNLHLHPATRVVARFPEPIDGWREVPQAYHVDEFIPDGVFIQGQFVPPDVQAPIVPGFGHAHKQAMSEFRRFASFGALVSDDSSGRVFQFGKSVDPVPAYRMNRADARKLVFGICRTAELFFDAGAEVVYSGISGLPRLNNKSDVARLERMNISPAQIEVMAFHPMGTARTGDQRLAACDPWGRIHGYTGVAVADGSLLPTSNRINPQLTIMALSHRAAERWISHNEK